MQHNSIGAPLSLVGSSFQLQQHTLTGFSIPLMSQYAPDTMHLTMTGAVQLRRVPDLSLISFRLARSTGATQVNVCLLP